MAETDKRNQNSENELDISNERDKSGRFKPGHKRLGGNVKGSKHKYSRTVSEQIIAGIGKSKNAGGGGVEGFAQRLADTHAPAAASLLSKIADKIKPPAPAVTENAGFNIVSIPSGHFFHSSLDENGMPNGLVLVPPKEAFALAFPGTPYPFPDPVSTPMAQEDAPDPAPADDAENVVALRPATTKKPREYDDEDLDEPA